MEQRLSTLESQQADQQSIPITLQLQVEYMENRGRRNNVRLPEAMATEDLTVTVTNIVTNLLGNILPPNLEFNRVHRALGRRSEDPSRPKDVLIRFHRFQHREMVIGKAWDMGPMDIDGAQIKILPDISRATLFRRALLRPLLDLANALGFTYRWGFTLSVSFRKAAASFTLRSRDNLKACFSFMDTAPIDVPDWLQLLPHLAVRRQQPTTGRPKSHSSQPRVYPINDRQETGTATASE